MAFRFPLQTLLRFRQSIERRERLCLDLATREVLRARKQAHDADDARMKAREEVAKCLNSGLAAIELQFEVASDAVRRRRVLTLAEEVTRLDAQRAGQLKAYQKAQQKRKILENLRERQRALYRLKQDRRAQQQVDEGFLIRRRTSGAG
jgi:flagellar export protein FliJ